MFESRLVDAADQAVGGMLDTLTECASAESVRRGRLVEAVCEILDRRLADAEECGGDPSECHREVLCEISTQLTVSLSTGRTLLDTSETLNHLPLTALRLILGGIDWARVVVLASVPGKASARPASRFRIPRHFVFAKGGRRPRRLARAGTDEARSRIRELRRRFRQHRAAEDARERRRPAPY